MSDGYERFEKGLVKGAKQMAPTPLKAFATMIGTWLGRPDLADTATEMLQEDVVRLAERIEAHFARLSEEVRAKVDPIETLELVTQTVSNMGRTAQQDKRQLMANVLLHGLKDWNGSVAMRRLFIRAVSDLEVDHVSLLASMRTNVQLKMAPITTIEDGFKRALMNELVQRGFVDRIERVAGGNTGYLTSPPSLNVEYRISTLGYQFLDYVEDVDPFGLR